MRHGSSGRRSRNRSSGGGNRNRGTQNRSQVFDSNGPDVRIRGTAYQILEKYTALARDANGACDYILAESYLQHAEHYQRLINSWQDSAPAQDRRASQTEDDGIDEQETDDLALPGSIIGKPAVETAKKPELQDA